MKKPHLSLFMLIIAALILSGCDNWLMDKFKSRSKEATTLTVSFNTNGGSPIGPVEVAQGGTVNSPDNPTRAGYTFGGWYTDNGTFAKPYDFSTPVTGNLTLYAKWTGNAYTVIFDKNNIYATGTTADQSFTYGTENQLTANGFIRAGYTFEGWNTKADGTGTIYSNSQSVNNLTAINNGMVTLYAKWVFNPAAFALGGIGPGGGIIFYIDSSPAGFTVEGYGNPGDTGYFASYTAHYLEAAPGGWDVSAAPNDPQLMWAPVSSPAYNSVQGLSADEFDETDWALGRGKKNTALILACLGIAPPESNAPAAHACDNYTSPNSTGDWFLPSKNELNLLYINKTHVPSLNDVYWSSSQYDTAGMAWVHNFSNDYKGYNGKQNASPLVVRAIRAF